MRSEGAGLGHGGGEIRVAVEGEVLAGLKQMGAEALPCRSPCVSLCRLPNACPTHADQFRVSERVRQAWARTDKLRHAQEALTHRTYTRTLSQTRPASS